MKIPNKLFSFDFNSKPLETFQKLIKDTPHKSDANSNIQNLNSKTINDILQKLNLKSTKLNKEIIQKLIKYQLPITKNLLIEIKNLINKEKNQLTPTIQAVVLLKKAKFKISTSNIKLLTNFLINKPDISTNLQKIINQSPKSQKILDQLSNFILKPNNNQFSPQDIKATILNYNNSQPKSNLKGLLYTLKNNQTPILNSLVDKAIYNLTSQKLIMHQNESSDTNFLYLQLPLQINENELTTGHLTIYNQRKKKKPNPKDNSLTLILELDTQKLGLVNVKLKFNNNNLNINIKTKSKKTLNQIKKEISNLKDKIIDLGYKINNIDYSLLPAEAQPGLDLKNELDNQILKTNSLNLEDVLHSIDFTI